MKTTFILLFMLFFVDSFAQDGKNFIDQNYVEVTGKAHREIVPDEIYIQININESDYKGKESLEMLEKQMLNKLVGIGIDLKKDFSVKDMSSNFKNYWLKKANIYSSKEYELIVNSARVAGHVFRELEALGISNISIEKVDHSDIEKLQKEIKSEAVLDAKESAEMLAKPLGQKIGKAIYIRENEPFFRAQQASSMIRVKGIAPEAGYADPDIDFEKISLDYSVQVYFELLAP